MSVRTCLNRRPAVTVGGVLLLTVIAGAFLVAILLHLVEFGHIPLLELQTHADLQSLLRALEGIAAHDWLPNGAPNGVLATAWRRFSTYSTSPRDSASFAHSTASRPDAVVPLRT